MYDFPSLLMEFTLGIIHPLRAQLEVSEQLRCYTSTNATVAMILWLSYEVLLLFLLQPMYIWHSLAVVVLLLTLLLMLLFFLGYFA